MLFGLVALIDGYAIAEGRATIAIVFVALPLLILRRITRYDGLAVAVILTLAVPYWYTLGSPQAAVFRVAAVCALMTALFARNVRLTLVDGAVVAIVLVTVLSWLVQDDQPGVSKIVLNEMLPFALYVSARTLSAKHVGQIMTVIVIAGFVGAATVIYEFLAGHVLFVDPASYSWNLSTATIFRPGGFFGSPPGAATVLALAIMCGIPIGNLWNRKWRILNRTALAMMIVACVLTFTRASLIGLGIGFLAYLWLMRSSLVTPTRLLVAVFALSIIVVAVLPRVENTRTFQQGIIRPGNLAVRESYWKLALPIITASPHNVIFGIGAEQTLMPRYGGTMPSTLASSPVLIERGTHNQYILTALEEGLVGLLALIVWIAATIRTGLRTVRREHDPLSAALVGATVTFAVTMLANNALLHPPSFAMAALVSGLIVARSTMKNAQRDT
jgi:O-antigen ligase